MNKSIVLFATALTFVACDRSGDDYVPAADGTYPAVIDVGEMAVMTQISSKNCVQKVAIPVLGVRTTWMKMVIHIATMVCWVKCQQVSRVVQPLLSVVQETEFVSLPILKPYFGTLQWQV